MKWQMTRHLTHRVPTLPTNALYRPHGKQLWITTSTLQSRGYTHNFTASKNLTSTMTTLSSPRDMPEPSKFVQGNMPHRAAIALGSNMGDRVAYIEEALRQMQHRGLRLLSVSKLYQTKAMYYVDQDPFINGACYVETSLGPIALLDTLQEIENDLGRVRKVEKGPRTIDLDILLYDYVHMTEERLEIPHKLILEREFVLRPLADILPQHTFPLSFTDANKAVISVGAALAQVGDSRNPMHAITNLKSPMPFLVADDSGRQTRLMSILNITPDSFSDGGELLHTDLDEIQNRVRKDIAAGAAILDVGGQSTRPRAEPVSAKEELRRVLPVVEAIRALPEAENIAISVDTFHSQVAAETIRSGADIINDISAGLLDPNMLPTVAESGKTIVLMHTRGNPHTMTQLTDYPDGVIAGVARELQDRLRAALQAGILPWRIILDPGIGFAKTQSQNLELLRGLDHLRKTPAFRGLPWLLGVSRKGFIGNITDVQDAKDRIWGTAAAVTASIAGGSDIVRVHDASQMQQVLRMSDAIYRFR